jgi:hypothetical protein
MLAPPQSLRPALRSWARETVHLFGQPLDILACPFMQQDNQVDVCAHVCAWMVHFTMFLREREFSRRCVAEFPIRSGEFVNPARPVVGDGMTSRDIERLLSSFDLPTQPIECVHGDPLEPLPYPWGPLRDWYDPTTKAVTPTALARRSIAEIACRYLNSGYPLYVDLGGHSVVVCGYEGSDEPDVHVKYIGHDDARGPYVTLDDPRHPQLIKQWKVVVAPLPEHVSITPRAAEAVALARFKEAFDIVNTEASDGDLGTEDWGHRPIGRLMERGELKRRTYLVRANEWKRDLKSRDVPEQLRTLYCEQPMSRHISVTEFIEVRAARDSVVRGEVILDATASETNPHVLALRVGNVVTLNPSVPGSRTHVVTRALPRSGARGSDQW